MAVPSKGTILVVDDELGVQTLLERLLGAHGYSVVTAQTAAEATSRIAETQPDVLLIDVGLPDVDGLAFVRSLRHDPQTAHLPLLLMTAATEADEVERASELETIVGKPFGRREILTWVRALMSIRDFQKSFRQAEETLVAIAAAVEARSLYPASHLHQVAAYSTQLATVLGLADEEVAVIRTAALLRDLGNVAVPDTILTKPGALSVEELSLVRQHPVLGADLCRHLRFGDHISVVVLGHHERWDGTGYPEGLAQDAIPLGARIVAVADAFAAHTADRPYRKALSRAAAQVMLASGAGSQWEARLVTAFEQVIAGDRAQST